MNTSKVFALTLALFISATVMANQSDLPKPEQSLVAELKSLCEGWAEEDGIKEEELATYVLNCVNSELSDMGYQTLERIESN